MSKNLQEKNFTEGPILRPLLSFAFPVLLALILQAMYGAVDLLVVGKYASSADVSAVSTGSQLMGTITTMIASFSMGTTILLGQKIGQGKSREGGNIIGSSILLFLVIGCVFTVFLAAGADVLAEVMHAPAEAYEKTVNYIRICGSGALVIIFYNLIGSVFRGMGDSRTPLVTVAIACVINIVGDLFFVAVMHMGTEGAALATVLAQFSSVVISLILIRRKELPFTFEKSMIRMDGGIVRKIASLGVPVALQELLVGISFLVIAAIVNSLGLIPSAGVGVAEKVCMFIMLVPSAFMQSLSAFVAQNYGAGKIERAYKTLRIAIMLSFAAGVVMSYASFVHGDVLAGMFSNDLQVVAAAHEYLKAYAIDCLLTAFFFCFIGFFNGVGKTHFVMIQGICGAFCIRVPVSYIMSQIVPVSLFRIGLATPCSSMVQIVMCLVYLRYVGRKMRQEVSGEKSQHPGSKSV